MVPKYRWSWEWNTNTPDKGFAARITCDFPTFIPIYLSTLHVNTGATIHNTRAIVEFVYGELIERTLTLVHGKDNLEPKTWRKMAT
jgi:hypothetical protein